MFNEPFLKNQNEKPKKFNAFKVFVGILIGAFLTAIFALGVFYGDKFKKSEKLPDIASEETLEESEKYEPFLQHEQTIIRVVEEVSPAVVSIVASKDIPIIERRLDVFEDPFGFRFQIPQYEEKGTERKEIGGGSGFIISSEGMVLTNRHVIEDEEADFTIFTSDGEEFEAEIVARDPVQDLAIIQIKGKSDFPVVKLGDSSKAIIGQTAIAIGNALGEFKNTVSVGVVSGLERTVSVSDGGQSYIFEGVIQTDAAINRGNSGGPLLNLKGEVIGINTAMAIGAQNIGFSIPIDKAKRAIESFATHGEIVYPFLGVRYLTVNDSVKKENNFSVDYGAWISRGSGGEPAVDPGSAAEKAGIRENDIILEFNGRKISEKNSLAQVILDYNPGDKVSIKILRSEKEIFLEAVLGKRTN